MTLSGAGLGRMGGDVYAPDTVTLEEYRRLAVAREAACTVDGCDRPRKARGYCNRCWLRWWKHGDPTATRRPTVRGPCSVPGCGRPHRARGLCGTHLARFYAHGHPDPGRPVRRLRRQPTAGIT